jgi:MoaA/NifB/PqqE/SkfB family radical SAM enzyme
MEGFEQETDQRRGAGIYSKLNAVMKRLKAENIIYGASVTVTSANFETITSIRFIDGLRELGCKLIFFIEYVPVEKGTEHLALSESQKVDLENVILRHKQAFKDMIFISFPGDEKFMGGCLAAGRGFFHINPQGDAEACPFSPYSDRNLKDHTLFEVLRSPFFEKLRDAELVGGEHTGGCALFEHEEEVRQLLNSKTGNV